MLGPLAPLQLGPLAVVGGSRIVVSDSFAGIDGTLLTAHTPGIHPSGEVWTVPSGVSNQILGNKAARNASLAQSWNFIDAGVANCTISLDWVQAAFAAGASVVFRAADSAHFWSLYYVTGPTWQLYEVNPTATLRAAANLALTNGQTYRMSVALSNTSIIAKVDGVTILTFASGALQSNTQYGFVIEKLTPDLRIDNFLITVP